MLPERPSAAGSKSVRVTVNDRRWRGLEYEAQLLTRVFGRPITPQRVAQAVVEQALNHRERAV